MLLTCVFALHLSSKSSRHVYALSPLCWQKPRGSALELKVLYVVELPFISPFRTKSVVSTFGMNSSMAQCTILCVEVKVTDVADRTWTPFLDLECTASKVGLFFPPQKVPPISCQQSRALPSRWWCLPGSLPPPGGASVLCSEGQSCAQWAPLMSLG